MKYQKIVEAYQVSAQTRDEICKILNGGIPGDHPDKMKLEAWFYESNGDAEMYVGYGDYAGEGDFVVINPDSEITVMPEDKFKAEYTAMSPQSPPAPL